MSKDKDEVLVPNDQQQLEEVLYHIGLVRDNCTQLGKRLSMAGEDQLGLDLIALGLIHDVSKIQNHLEFKSLRRGLEGSEEFNAALLSHVTTNLHHPEAWNGIEEMPRLYVAEMVCDWKSRATAFGTNLRDWIKNGACDRFNFSSKGRVYKEISEFVNMVCDKPF